MVENNDPSRDNENPDFVQAARPELTPDKDHSSHDWPQADEDFCSCCRGKFVHGFVNIVRIKTTPEKQFSTKGEYLGEENRKPLFKAYLHATCWKRHFGQQVECEKCGGFSKHKTLQNGTTNPCMCTCHTGSNHCSFVLDPNRSSILGQL